MTSITRSQMSALECLLAEMEEEREMMEEIRTAMQAEGFLAAFYPDDFNPLEDSM